MAYLHLRQNPALGYYGAGLGCGCARCGESGHSLSFLGEPATAPAPVFAIDCPDPPSCPPAAASECRRILREAIREAIKLADNAAEKLEARDPEVVKFFRFFFHHPPNHPIPWAGGEESAVSIAKRYRAVSKALQKDGRNTTFRCLGTTGTCATANAFVIPEGPDLNVINLCASFWDPPAGLRGLPAPTFRGGIILHEMLHLLFHEFLLHGVRRANSHCYEAFALRVAGYGVERIDICSCRGDCPP